MLVDFSEETQIVNKLRAYLVVNGWHIIQLVSPGGQAHFSISYKMNGKLKNIFPDLIACSNNEILIAEVKPTFDLDDHNKLLELKNSEEALDRIIKVMGMRMEGTNYQKSDITFALVHSNCAYIGQSLINQYILKDENFIFDFNNEK